MTFSYYVDTNKYNYNYNSFPYDQSLGDIITTPKIAHKDTTLTIAF